MSAALHMVANGGDTEGLFRGAFMQSGAVLANGDISLGQQDYDNLVQTAGCAGSKDTLECLRQVPFQVLKKAVDLSPTIRSYRVCRGSLSPLSQIEDLILQATNLVWIPRADGTFLKAPAQELVLRGSVAKIPFVTGSKNPEGLRSPVDQPIRPLQATATTKQLFSLCPASTLRESISGREVTPPEHPYPRTNAQFEEYIRSTYFPAVGGNEFRELVDQYPSGWFYTFSAVSEDTEIRCTRCHSGVSLWHGNPQRFDATIQEDRVYPGRHYIPRPQKVFPRTTSAGTKRLVIRYYSLLSPCPFHSLTPLLQ